MVSDNFKFLFNESVKVSKSLSGSLIKATNSIATNKKLTSTKDKAKARIEICNRCNLFNKNSGRCEECGCFITIKVKMDFEQCPLGKW